MRRTITLPDDDGRSVGAGSVKIDELAQIGPRALAVSYPDTLEIIHRPSPAALLEPAAPSAPARPGALRPAAPPPPPAETEPPGTPSLDDHRSPEPQPTHDLQPAPEPRPTLEPRPGPDQEITRSAPEELELLLQQFRDERQRRRSVRAAKVLVALLAGGLLAVWLLRPPLSGGDENRAQTAFPSLSPSGLLNGKDYRQTDKALRDRLALRQYVVKSVGKTARDQMGTSLNSAVVMGSTGVPFISEDFIFPCQYTFEPAKVDAGLRELQALGRTTGKSIMVAIAPDKSSILTDQLGSRAGSLMACSNDVRRATQSTWTDGPDSPVLYTWKQMLAEQKAHPGQVFQRGDSHWTSQGALVWSKAVINRLIESGEAPASLHKAPIATRVRNETADNDLYRLMGISKAKETVPVWRVNRPQVKITDKVVPSPSGRGIYEFHAVSSGAPLIKGRTLVVNDSFFSRAEGELDPYFSDLKVMHWSDFMTAVQKGNLPHFDRVIIETVQRGWPERAGWLEQGQPVHDALAQELSRGSRTTAVRPPEPAAAS